MSGPSDLATAALAYAARGIGVFPLREREKEPVAKGGFKQASADRDQVARWWRGRPRQNIGIATGPSAGFWVLDLDGPEAEAALAALVAQHGPLPATAEQSTGKGRHVCFAWDPAAREIRNRSRLFGAPIDVRGAGGYIVAPPSIHPSGRQYAWTPGRAPEEVGFAAAPDWLTQLVLPAEPVATPVAPPTRRDGRASRFGEAVLDTACGVIAGARVGARDSTLYRTACKIGGLVASGHIDQAYARDTLISVGRTHVPSAMTEAQLVRQVERALAWAASRPWGPDETAPRRPSLRVAPAARSPIARAVARQDGVEAWNRAGVWSGAASLAWFERRGLDPDGLDRSALRWSGAAAVLGLMEGPGGAVRGALLENRIGDQRLAGETAGLVGILVWPAGVDQILVASRIDDAWALGSAARAGGEEMAVVVAPRLSTLAGAPMGDRWGRSQAETPLPDPEQPPWTWPGMARVWLAVRRDVRGPPLPQRRQMGGTVRRRLDGDEAWRFWGALAEAGWRAAGAGAVKVMAPSAGRVGFCEMGGVTS
ncbi:MAG: bifunctional DNA primase/polymerase [Caulobacter sp.]|nr:bifunctional DNA primase/polymerase [Caulobacter sp.]